MAMRGFGQSSTGLGRNCALPMRVPSPNPVLGRILVLIGPEILASGGTGVWKKVAGAFPDSNSVPKKFLSPNIGCLKLTSQSFHIT